MIEGQVVTCWACTLVPDTIEATLRADAAVAKISLADAIEIMTMIIWRHKYTGR